jgi:hypothetical protein
MYKSKNPEDITEWKNPVIIAKNDTLKYPDFSKSYTYMNPVKLSAEKGRIFLFWRGLDGKPTYSTSEDNGETWSTGKIFVMPERVYTFRRPYVKIYSDGKAKIHIAFTDGHPRNEKENSIYYMYYQNGAFYKTNGQKIAGENEVPVTPRQADVAYDATVTRQKGWIWDLAADENGLPSMVYTKFPNDSNHIYCHTKWNGKAWITSNLINSSKWFPTTPEGKTEPEPNYSGGMSIDHENNHILYLSVKRNEIFEIEKWTSAKDGKSWTVEFITKDSAKDNIRPFAIRNAKDGNPLQIIWMSIDKYVHYTNYKTSLLTNIR